MERDPPKKTPPTAYPPVVGIDRASHIDMVREIFATITGRYDFLNHLLSLGRDKAWRRATVRRLFFFQTFRLLDVATGTADLAIGAALSHRAVQVTGIDFSPEMLALGRRKLEKQGLGDRVSLVQGDAVRLPFPDGTFDDAVMAFGIRNIPDRLQALKELRRVLVPGGYLLILEMHFPQNRLWKAWFGPYLIGLLPRIARLFSANPAAYRYLGDSILHFPGPSAFLALMGEAGFSAIEQQGMTFGITRLYRGRA